MLKACPFFFLFLVVVLVLVPCVLLAAGCFVSETEPVADLVNLLLPILPAAWDGWVTLAVTLCAAISSVWARPAEDANILIRLLYSVVNAIGFNLGKARNADDVFVPNSRPRG